LYFSFGEKRRGKVYRFYPPFGNGNVANVANIQYQLRIGNIGIGNIPTLATILPNMLYYQPHEIRSDIFCRLLGGRDKRGLSRW
jgi:hypothetical protein